MDISSGANSQAALKAMKVDVNTDDIQKVVYSTAEQDDAQSAAEPKAKEAGKSPVQHLMAGQEKEAKQELLKDFIEKVASSDLDIMLSGDKGRKDTNAINEMKLLFGEEFTTKDQISITAESRMAEAATVLSIKKSGKMDDDVADDDKGVDEEMLKGKVFEEKEGVRGRVHTRPRKKETEMKDELAKDMAQKKESFEKEDDMQDGSGRRRRDVEFYEKDEDTISYQKIRQRAVQELAAELAEDDIEEDEPAEETEDDSVEGAVKTDVVAQIKAEEISDDADLQTDSEMDEPVRRATQEAREEAPVSTAKGDLLEHYAETYRHHLLSSARSMEQIENLENELQKLYGITSKQLKDTQLAVKRSIRSNLRDRIKDSIIQKQLSVLDKIDALTADTRLNKFTDYFVSNLLLGGQDFGNFDDGFQGLINKAMYYASKDLANFSIEELEQFVMSESLDQNKEKVDKIADFEKKVQDLNSITNNPKVTEEWAQAAMEVFMKDYGLAKEKIDLHQNDTLGQMVNTETSAGGFSDSQQQKRQDHGYEFDEKDEKDIFINRLRALYLQRALNPGLGTTLGTEFKLRRLKNGLLRMGVYTDILNEQISHEAQEIAKGRTMEMLNEALLERASFYETRGPAFNLVENKIKGVLKNAERLGMEIDKELFEKIRDEMNTKMYEVTKKEMDMIEVRLSDLEFPALVVKYREMQRLLERLREESGIEDHLELNDKFANISVVESA